MTEFHGLYQRYAPHVHRWALFLCGDPALADDITSETFIRAWTAPGPIREETVKAYLFTIARNLHHDFLRGQRRNSDLDDSIIDRHADTQKRAEVRSELELVLGAMQELSESERAALILRAQEEMSYEEISIALGLSVTAVKVRIHRARMKLMQTVKMRMGRKRLPKESL
ncbi:MAG TPA: RNA polymerase sigma factor [Candidatus Sulfotelmatobacter sp.]|nr:RNA polymerase sigma factor [Candidatus Sulfotelmatobacter sp.]